MRVTAIEVRLFGAMQLRVDGAPARLPGPAERRLLALLLLSPGRTVPTSSLIDRLWGEGDLPSDPLNALQIRVSKLRRVLAQHGLDVLSREASGYRVDIAADSVDLHRFAQTVRSARAATARAGGPNDAALSLYDDALALCRGGVLADFAGDSWATVEAARLDQLRMAAITERAETALALGRHVEVVADLEPLLSEQPTQEVLAGLLMTALYRSGRQADALDVYARTRDVLDSELGLEPSPALRALQQRILRQDPGLAGEPEAAAAVTVALARPAASVPPTSAAPPVGLETTPEAPPAVVLPTEVTPLVGRDEEMAAVSRLLSKARVVTLVGPGGAGKTTLAFAVARQLAETAADVRVARLAAAGPAEVALVVADAVGVPLDGADPTADIHDRLMSYLRHRRVLLVLDNCEHVVDVVARLVDGLVPVAPELTVLATSREALAIRGEVQFALSPLAVPPDATPPERVLGYAAARLFVDRATAVRSNLALTPDDLVAVNSICRQLDGMPLALELAAARVASLSLAELAERLGDRFALLTTGPRTAEARQRTLRATVDWSHALLTDQERVVFRRLAVFHTGWTLAAAEAVTPGEGVAEEEVLDLIDHLVQRSMVVSDGGHPTRFRMLETLRQYAFERLVESHEHGNVAARHAAYFRRFAEDADRSLRGRGQRDTLRRLREENANLRAALGWLSADPARIDDALRLAGSLGLYWHLGRHVEGREVLRDLMRSAPPGSRAARARALQAVSLVERPRACLVHPSIRCGETAHESLELFVAEGDAGRAALSRVLLAVQLIGGLAASEFVGLLRQAEQQFEATGDEWGLAVIAFVRLQDYLVRGDDDRARVTGRVAADAFRALDDPWGLSAVLYHLGWGLREFGQYAGSVPVLEEAIDVALSAGLHNTAQWALADLGLSLLYLNDSDGARECFDRAAAASREIGDAAGEVLAAYGRGVMAQMAGDADAARSLFTEATAGFTRLGTPLPAGQALTGLAWCDLVQGNLDRSHDRYSEVRQMASGAAEPALTAAALEGLALVAAARDDPATAVALVAEAATLRRSISRPTPPHERALLAPILTSDAAAAAISPPQLRTAD